VLVSGCSGSPSTPAPTTRPTPHYVTKVSSTGVTWVTLLSDDEIRDMELHTTSLFNIPSERGLANLAPGTHLVDRLAPLHKLNVGLKSTLDFYPVRVMDGPAKGLNGWVSALALDPEN